MEAHWADSLLGVHIHLPEGATVLIENWEQGLLIVIKPGSQRLKERQELAQCLEIAIKELLAGDPIR